MNTRTAILRPSSNLWKNLRKVILALDRGSGRIVRRSAQQDTLDGDVLDDLAEATLAQGHVVMLERTGMPRHSPVAAILRW